jgi:hypothetical protein
MQTFEPSSLPARVRHLRLILSVLAIGLVAAAALLVPRVIQTAHAAPKPTNTCAQPPAGKDPTTFTPQQLRSYGLPARLPHQDQALWAKMVRHATHRVCTPMSTRPAHAHFRTPPNPSATPQAGKMNSECDACWAGYEAYGMNYNLNNVWGVWQVPCVPDNASLKEDGFSFSTWVGVGGDLDFNPNNLAFVQTGTEGDYETIFGAHSVPLPSATYTAWVELLGQPFLGTEAAMTVFNISCNDWVMAEVDAVNNIVWIGDFNNSQYYSQTFVAAATTEAECIVEQPGGNGVFGLLDFGTQTFTQCLANDANSNTFGGINMFTNEARTSTEPFSINIPLFGTQTIDIPKAEPGPIDTSNSNGSFAVTWLTS